MSDIPPRDRRFDPRLTASLELTADGVRDDDDEKEEEEGLFGLADRDALIDSGILSGREAYAEAFGVDDDRNDRFSL